MVDGDGMGQDSSILSQVQAEERRYLSDKSTSSIHVSTASTLISEQRLYETVAECIGSPLGIPTSAPGTPPLPSTSGGRAAAAKAKPSVETVDVASRSSTAHNHNPILPNELIRVISGYAFNPRLFFTTRFLELYGNTNSNFTALSELDVCTLPGLWTTAEDAAAAARPEQNPMLRWGGKPSLDVADLAIPKSLGTIGFDGGENDSQVITVAIKHIITLPTTGRRVTSTEDAVYVFGKRHWDKNRKGINRVDLSTGKLSPTVDFTFQRHNFTAVGLSACSSVLVCFGWQEQERWESGERRDTMSVPNCELFDCITGKFVSTSSTATGTGTGNTSQSVVLPGLPGSTSIGKSLVLPQPKQPTNGDRQYILANLNILGVACGTVVYVLGGTNLNINQPSDAMWSNDFSVPWPPPTPSSPPSPPPFWKLSTVKVPFATHGATATALTDYDDGSGSGHNRIPRYHIIVAAPTSVHRYDVSLQKWFPLTPMKKQRSGHALFSVASSGGGHRLVVFGGGDPNSADESDETNRTIEVLPLSGPIDQYDMIGPDMPKWHSAPAPSLMWGQVFASIV